MHLKPVRHSDEIAPKRIAGHFRQLARMMGVNARQLHLDLMENYINHWRLSNQQIDIRITVADNDFRIKLKKPIPLFIHVSGFNIETDRTGIPFLLPDNSIPYERYRVVSGERFALKNPDCRPISGCRLLPITPNPSELEWEGYINIFEPCYHEPQFRLQMILDVQKTLLKSVEEGIRYHLFSFSHNSE